MKMPFAALALAVLVLGCVIDVPNNGLVMEMQADPPLILENGVTLIHVDVTNTDTKPLNDVDVYIFNAGGLLSYDETGCRQKGVFGLMKPGEFRTFFCKFQAGKINQDRLSTEVSARASFWAEFSAVQQLEVITEDEYQNRLATSTFQREPQVYTYSDRNLQLQVEFTEPPPIVIKTDRAVYVKFTLKNIGNGFIGPVFPSYVRILKQSAFPDVEEPAEMLAASDGQSCRLENTIYPIGNDFPSFSCQVLMKSNSMPMSSKGFTIKVRYSYELRDKVRVDIAR